MKNRTPKNKTNMAFVTHKVFLVLRVMLVIALLIGVFPSMKRAEATPLERPLRQTAAWELIAAMNVWRTSNGLPALIEDATINAVAQATAQTMADQNLSWHIGNVAGRLQGAGYGGGKKVFATENFAMTSAGATIDQIMPMWDDPDHRLPATNPNYCHVGAGVATASNGFVYYILQAAYVSGEACTGSYTPPGGGTGPGTGPGSGITPGIIVPVELVEADESGIFTHIVKPGQSLWAIAVAYKTTIKNLRDWNNLPESYSLQIGDELIILGPDAEGFVPAPKLGEVKVSPPDADGRVVHVVQAYEYLGKIAAAYGVTVKQITDLNNIQETTPLGIGWELVIVASNHTPTPTERPLTPIERLTPAADGKYYHVVGEGASLAGIANIYGIPLADLLAWNGLKETSIIYPGDKLLLNVTPPATITPTFTPVTPSPTASMTSTPTKSPTPTLMPTIAATATMTPMEKAKRDLGGAWLPIAAGVATAAAVFLLLRYLRRQKGRNNQ